MDILALDQPPDVPKLQTSRDEHLSLDEIFKSILRRYKDVTESIKYGRNNEIGDLFEAAVNKLNESWEEYPKYKAIYGYGVGVWADVPWISICEKNKAQDDERLTSFTYIFAKDGTSIYLTVMARSKSIKGKFKKNANTTLEIIAQHIKDFYLNLPQLGMELSVKPAIVSHTDTGKSLIKGVSAWKRYNVSEMPSEEQLLTDAKEIFNGYDQFLQENIEINTEKNTGDEMDAVNQSEISEPLNQILYGPPGTGKTYATTELAVKIVDCKFYDEQLEIGTDEEHSKSIKKKYDELVDKKRIVFTTFHQSFAYEDFIEGIRATTDENGNLRYDVVDGIFKRLCKAASENPDDKYLLIIDEINRGNISRIFGELITLLEPSKRKGQADARSVVLPYSKDKESFSVPNNVYVIGTMNTADKSLAPLDLALRRRFSFVETPPKPELLRTIVVHEVNLETLVTVVNERIEAILDRDHLIGHAYFMDLINSENKEYDLAKIFEQKIIPLLQEYFFDDWERIGWVLNDSEKDDGSNFIKKGGGKKINQLFPNKPEENLPEDRRYRINPDAFESPTAYKRILGKD